MTARRREARDEHLILCTRLQTREHLTDDEDIERFEDIMQLLST